jgi:sec-independent protein translocase protein TatC
MPVETDPDKDERDDEEQLSGQMSFLDHLEELRKRIIHSLIAVAIAFGVFCPGTPWSLADYLFQIVSVPVRKTGAELITTTLTGAFNLELKLAVLASIFLAAPFILGQVWLFISPGLYRHERRYALPFIVSSSVLFILGGVFAYFIAFPFAAEFLVDWTKRLGIVPRIDAGEYFDLFMMVELGLAIIFEIPALIFVLARIGLVSGPFLLRNTRYAILIAVVVAAVITPTTDIPNLMMMAVPMIALYMLGVLVAYVFGKKRKTDDD